MRRLLVLKLLVCGACAAPVASPQVSEQPPAAAERSVDWSAAVEAEARALEDGHPGAEVRIVVLDAAGIQVLAKHGDVETATATGSTMKPLTVFAALGAGLDPATTIDASTPLEVDGETIQDASNNGVLTLSQAIAKSSNVAVAQVVQRVGWEVVYPRVSQLVPLPDSTGMSELEAIAQLDGFVTAVPLRQLASAYATMAEAPEGAVMLEMLRLAVGPEGTGGRAAVPGLEVLGKTGTARHDGTQDAVFVGRVSDGETSVWIAVSVHDVAEDAYGGAVAAPAFARIAAAALSG